MGAEEGLDQQADRQRRDAVLGRETGETHLVQWHVQWHEYEPEAPQTRRERVAGATATGD